MNAEGTFPLRLKDWARLQSITLKQLVDKWDTGADAKWNYHIKKRVQRALFMCKVEDASHVWPFTDLVKTVQKVHINYFHVNPNCTDLM